MKVEGDEKTKVYAILNYLDIDKKQYRLGTHKVRTSVFLSELN